MKNVLDLFQITAIPFLPSFSFFFAGGSQSGQQISYGALQMEY